MIEKAELGSKLFIQAKRLTNINDNHLDCIVSLDSNNNLIAALFYDVVKERIVKYAGDKSKIPILIKRAIKEMNKLGIENISAIVNNEDVNMFEKLGFKFTKYFGELVNN